MKVLLAIAAYLILSVSTEDLDSRRWRGQWTAPNFNRTQWIQQSVNRSQSHIKNQTNTRLQHLNQALNRSRQRDSDRQQWFQALNLTYPNNNSKKTHNLLAKINRTQAHGQHALNRTEWRLTALNRTRRRSQWTGSNFNKTQWLQNITDNKLQYLNQALNQSQQSNNRKQFLLGKINRTELNGPTEWRAPKFNKSQWIEQSVNRSQWQIQNQTDTRLQHLNQALNRSQQQDRDRQQWLQALNLTDSNNNSNKTQNLLAKINRTQAHGQHALNRTEWRLAALNRTQWTGSNFNKTQWLQDIQLQQSNETNFNRTQWAAPNFNKSLWIQQLAERDQSQIQNETDTRLQSLNQALNRSQQGEGDRQQWLQALNLTSFNSTNFNKTQFLYGKINRTQLNGFSRTRRATWVNPWNQTTHNGDVIIGQISYLDRLLFNQTYLKERRWWSGREKIVEYPKDLSNGWNRHENITAIRIYNKFYDGLESTAEIESGGIGYRYVKIKLSSPWHKGFHYMVQIFGH